MICDTSDFRLEKAAALGFEVCNNGNEDLKEAASSFFGEAPGLAGLTADVDIYIDAAGAESILETYQSMGRSSAGWWSLRFLRESGLWIS